MLPFDISKYKRLTWIKFINHKEVESTHSREFQNANFKREHVTNFFTENTRTLYQNNGKLF